MKREDYRPITHIKNRPPMMQKSMHFDDISEENNNSDEEYDVLDE